MCRYKAATTICLLFEWLYGYDTDSWTYVSTVIRYAVSIDTRRRQRYILFECLPHDTDKLNQLMSQQWYLELFGISLRRRLPTSWTELLSQQWKGWFGCLYGNDCADCCCATFCDIATVISWTICNISTATITNKLNWTAVSTEKGMVWVTLRQRLCWLLLWTFCDIAACADCCCATFYDVAVVVKISATSLNSCMSS